MSTSGKKQALLRQWLVLVHPSGITSLVYKKIEARQMWMHVSQTVGYKQNFCFTMKEQLQSSNFQGKMFCLSYHTKLQQLKCFSKFSNCNRIFAFAGLNTGAFYSITPKPCDCCFKLQKKKRKTNIVDCKCTVNRVCSTFGALLTWHSQISFQYLKAKIALSPN